jgi:hypothetical protein
VHRRQGHVAASCFGQRGGDFFGAGIGVAPSRRGDHAEVGVQIQLLRQDPDHVGKLGGALREFHRRRGRGGSGSRAGIVDLDQIGLGGLDESFHAGLGEMSVALKSDEAHRGETVGTPPNRRVAGSQRTPGRRVAGTPQAGPSRGVVGGTAPPEALTA